MATFIGTNGNNTFTGGTGTDTVTFADNAAGYRIEALSGGRIRVVDIDLSDGNTGSDTLSSIEILSFADKSYAVANGPVLGPEGAKSVTDMWEPSDPAITTLADGGWVTTWTSTSDVYAQRYDSTGRPVGEYVRVNSNSHFAETPNIAAMQDGGYVIVWSSDGFGSTTGHEGIYAQRFDAEGVRVGARTLVNTTSGDSMYETPDITVLANGDYVISWQGNDLYARRFSADGTPLSAQVSISNSFDPYAHIYRQEFPVLAGLADGGYVICYGKGPAGLDGDDLYARRFDASGNAVGTEFLVSAATTDNQMNPAITGLSDGGFVIVWESGEQDSSNGIDIYARRFDADGDAVGGDIHVNTTPANPGFEVETPEIVELAGGGFVVTWVRYLDVYAQLFAADGSKLGDEIHLAKNNDAETTPAITANPDGGFTVSWSAEELDGSLIYAQRFDASGKAWGALSVAITGTSAADVMQCGAGSQELKGLGGNDTLNGGDGVDAARFANDSSGYRVAYLGSGRVQVLDIDTSNGNMGTDILTGIEALNFSDKRFSISTADKSVLKITGTAGDDVFTAGAGALQLAGLAGNDSYILTTSASRAAEGVDGGTDTVLAACTFTLTANVERLILTGTGNFNGTGNSGNNRLTGNGGNNKLDGRDGVDTLIGGAGNDILYDYDAFADTLSGGSGNDYYNLKVSTTTLIEAAGGGTDTVSIDGNYTLGDNFENLWLEGDRDSTGIGNALNNDVFGGGGNNILNGGAGNDRLLGGDGNDALTGGAGKDAFEFSRWWSGFDTIKDFNVADDSIHLRDDNLKALNGAGTLKAGFFRASSMGAAADANDYILYETDTGKLFYDLDGNGSSAKVLLAVLVGHPTLTASDFVVV